MASPSEPISAADRMRIRLLGPVEIEPNHAGALTRGSREVLAYLICHGSTRRTKIATSIWPEVDETQALFYLRRALSELRKNLGNQAERLQTPSQSIVEFDVSNIDVDFYQLRERLKSQDLDGSVEIYRHDFLDGIHSPWALEVRDQLESQMLRLLVQSGHLAAGMGDSDRALELWREAIEIKSTDESVWQAIIRLHVRDGNAAAAQTVLKECELVFRSTLARGVSSKTRALIESVSVFAALELSPPPPALGDIVGRGDLLADVLADLSPRSLVTLIGVGGVGKTRLAVEVARRSASQFPDGVCFVELAPVEADRVTDEISKALGFRAPGGSPWRSALHSVGPRRVLLVIDNAEHVLPQTARAVEEFLTAATQASVLVTSRTPLGLANEIRKRIPSLPESNAYALFCSRARAASSQFQPSDAAAKLCAMLDGIPLAIELTAANAGNVPLTNLSEELAKDLALDSTGQVRAGRHETMRAAILASVQTIPQDLREKFVRLSVFTGGFTLEAAMEVAGLIPSKLAFLADRSLIEFDGKRYRILEPVRQLSRELLAQSGEEQGAIDRLVAHFGDKSIQLFDGPFLYDRDPEKFNSLRAAWTPDDSNLRQCLEILRSQGAELSDRSLAIWLQRIWLRIIDHSDEEARSWLPRLERESVLFNSRLGAWWWYTVGAYSVWNDEMDRGPRLLRRVAENCQQLGFADVYAEVASAMNKDPMIDPRTGLERPGFDLAVDLFQELGDEERILTARMERAENIGVLGLSAEALETAIDVERRTSPDRWLRPRVLALRFLAKREPTLADKLRLMNEAVSLQRKRGHWAEVHTLRAIARLHHAEGTPEDEIEAWKRCLECAHRIEYRGSVAEAHLDLADAYRRAGNRIEAWRTIAIAMEMICALGRPIFLNQTIAILSGMAVDLGDPDCVYAAHAYAMRALARGELDLNARVQTQLEVVRKFIESSEEAGRTQLGFSSPEEIILYAQTRWSEAYIS